MNDLAIRQKIFSYLSPSDGLHYNLLSTTWVWHRHPDWLFHYTLRIVGSIDDLQPLLTSEFTIDQVFTIDNYQNNEKFNEEMDELMRVVRSMYLSVSKGRNLSAFGQQLEEQYQSPKLESTFKGLYYSLKPGWLIDVSTMKADGTGAKFVDPKKPPKTKRFKSDMLPIISNKLTTYKLALAFLGPIEQYQDDIDQFRLRAGL